MKNKLTRKLMLSAFTLLFAVISLGASTYAWFTMSNTANIEKFHANVKAGEGIEIAVTSNGTQEQINAAQWYTGTVPSDVIQDAAVSENFIFNAITFNGNSFNKIDSSAATEKVDYLSFYIHIKTAQAGTIGLTDITFDSKKGEQDVTYWTVDAEYLLADGKTAEINDKVLYKVENAARISFGQVTTLATGEQAAVVSNTSIYEKDSEACDGEATLNTVDEFTAGNVAGLQTRTSNTGAYAYYTSKKAAAVGVDESNYVTTRFSKVTEENVTTTIFKDAEGRANGVEGSTVDLELGETTNVGQILTIEVRVWIEGWDAECLNAIFAQTLFVELAFDFVVSPVQEEENEIV